MLARMLDRYEKPGYNIKSVLYSGVIALQRAHIRTASLDARVLLQHVLGINREQLLADDKVHLTSVQYGAYQGLIGQRLRRKPVSQLIGKREFWGLAFEVTEDTLDPRADSETLIEAVMAKCPDRQKALRILDLGTGTGCLLLTLLTEYENATGVGIDRSEAALQVAERNARALSVHTRVSFMESRWCESITAPEEKFTKEKFNIVPFDIIVSNPPYIPTGDIASLEPEVKYHEPLMALDGGVDGFSCYREILPHVPQLLATNGLAFFEIGMGQQQEVSTIAALQGMQVSDVKYDLGSVARCLVLHH
jgi:release factor glutamine methyltransferase